MRYGNSKGEDRQLHNAGSTRAAPAPAPEPSTVRLVEAAFKETRELVKIEFALAKLEATHQFKSALKAAGAFAAAAVLGIMTLCLLAVAIVLAVGGSGGAAVIVACICFALCGVAAFIGLKLLPRAPLVRSRKHLEDDLKQVKEHVA